jgi:hypothetical protein
MNRQEIPTWRERPAIIANLLNPAFCASILRTASKAYSKESKRPIPYALLFLILGIVLHKTTRRRMPKSTRTHLFAWIEANPDLRIDLHKRIKSMVPYTKEALLFLLNRDLIQIDKKTGGILTAKFRDPIIDDSTEIGETLKSSKLLARLLSKSGTVQTIYAILGIKP